MTAHATHKLWGKKFPQEARAALVQAVRENPARALEFCSRAAEKHQVKRDYPFAVVRAAIGRGPREIQSEQRIAYACGYIAEHGSRDKKVRLHLMKQLGMTRAGVDNLLYSNHLLNIAPDPRGREAHVTIIDEWGREVPISEYTRQLRGTPAGFTVRDNGVYCQGSKTKAYG